MLYLAVEICDLREQEANKFLAGNSWSGIIRAPSEGE